MRNLAFFSLLLFAPMAHAFSVEAPGPEAPLDVDTPWDGVATVSMTCAEWLAAADPASQTVVVALDINTTTPGILFTGPRTQIMPNDGCSSSMFATTSVDFPYSIQATMQAPGEVSIPYKVSAAAGNLEADTDSSLEVAFVGRLEVHVPIKIKQAGPQKEIPYVIEIKNFGNARAHVVFETPGVKLGQVVLPPELILDAPGGANDATQAILLYATPFHNGQNNDQEAIHLNVTAVSTEDPSQRSDPVEIDVLARTRGMYVPGPGAMWVPVILLALAVARARRPA